MTRAVVVLMCLLSACDVPPPGAPESGEAMAQRINLTALGLYTYPNPLSQVPNGAFTVADDVVIRREGIVETRRGFKPSTGTYGTSGHRLSSMGDFTGTLVAHTTGNQVVRYTGGAFSTYSGTYAPPAGRKMRFLQSAKSLYFTTDSGVKRVDELTGEVFPAGVPQATGGSLALSGSGAHATGTVTLAGGAGNVTITVGGTAVVTNFATSDTVTATNAAANLNANATVAALVSASAVGTVITLRAVNGGTAGNAITLTATRTAGTANASGSTLTGGTNGAGFLPSNTQVAYRFVWGIRNANDRVILGAPSGRVSLTNPATETVANASVSVSVPSWVTTSHFLQVYRADYSASATIPAGDDMGLVYETYATESAISSGSLAFTDQTPDELKGAPLYSSPNLGIPGSEKFEPPVCVDLADYKGRTWCAHTAQRQRLLLTLLSVDASSGGMLDGDTITFTQGGTTETYTASTAENAGAKEFQRFTSGTASQNVADTVLSLVRIINTTSALMRSHYVSGEYDSPGQFLIEAQELGADAIAAGVVHGTGTYWTPTIRPRTAAALQTLGTQAAFATTGPHNLVVGDLIEVRYVDPPSLLPAGTYEVSTVTSATQFRVAYTGPTGTGTAIYFAAPATTTNPTDAPNGIAYSEFGEPDAVPLGNYLEAGPANYGIQRIVTLGSTLFIFKEEGIYTLTGDSPETFNIQAFPTPAKVVAPESVAVLGNAIYALTDQGVMAFTESGAQLVSRPIEGTLNTLYAGDSALAATTAAVAFAVPYETEREYHLFVPTSSSDTYATQVYVFNYLTRAWVRWTVDATTGYVVPSTGLEVLGAPTTNGMLEERKTRTLTDYQDADGVAINARVDWAVIFGDNPSQYTQWQKCSVFYEADAPAIITMGMQTEISSMVSGPFDTAGLPYITSYVPVDQSRSQRFTLSASGGEAGKRLALTGSAVDYFSSTSTLRR